MDVSLLDKNNNTHMRKYTINSIDSFPEFRNKLYLSKIIISISILSLILGVYILIKGNYYFNPNYNFTSLNFLYYYIIIFTFGLFGILFLSFLITLFIKLFIAIKKCFKSRNKDIIEKEILLEENNINNNISLREIENADNIGLIPYTLSIGIFLNIILYVFGFPCSFYLIYCLIKNDIYSNFIDFFLIYLFIVINNISGGIFLFILFAFIRNRTYNSLRKMSFNYDEDNLMAVYKEVKDAINMVN